MTDEKQDAKGVEKPKTPQTPFGGWRNPASNPNDSSMADKGPQPVVSNSDGSQQAADEDPFAIPGTTQPKQEPHIKSFSATFGNVIEDTTPPPAPEADASWDEPITRKQDNPSAASGDMAGGGFSFAGGGAMFVENPDAMGAAPASSPQFITPATADTPSPQPAGDTQNDDPFAWSPQQQPADTTASPSTDAEEQSPRPVQGDGESWMQASTSYEELQSSTRAALEEAKRAEQPQEPEQPEEAPNPYALKEDEWVAPPMEIQESAAAGDKNTFEFDSPEVLPEQQDTEAEAEEEQPASPFDLALFVGDEAEEEIHAEPSADPAPLPAPDMSAAIPDTPQQEESASSFASDADAHTEESPPAPVADETALFAADNADDGEDASPSEGPAIDEEMQDSPLRQEYAEETRETDSAIPLPEPQPAAGETPLFATEDTAAPTPPVLPDEEIEPQPAIMAEEAGEPFVTQPESAPALETEQPSPAPAEAIAEPVAEPSAEQDSWQAFHAEQPTEATQPEPDAPQGESTPFAMPATQDMPDYIPPAQDAPEVFSTDAPAMQEQEEAVQQASADEDASSYPAPPPPMPESEPDAPLAGVLPSSEEVVSAWDIAAADEAASQATGFTAYTPQETAVAAEDTASPQENAEMEWSPSTADEAPAPDDTSAEDTFQQVAEEIPPAMAEQEAAGWEHPPAEAMAMGVAAAATGTQTHAPEDIQQIVQEHQQWLQSGGKDGRRANFRNANLQQFDFSNTQLAEASFRGANLYGAVFAHCDLHGADLSEAQLGQAQFHSAHLAGTVFSRADLRGAVFEASDLQGADFSGAALGEAVMAGLNLGAAIFLDADLQSANLSQSSLIGANLRGANLTQANLTAANLSGANCRDVQFQHAILDNAVLEGANLKNTSLQSASLLGADLSAAGDGSAEQRQDTLQAEREQLMQEWNRLKEYEGQIQQLQASLQQREMTLQTERVNAERTRREFKAQQESFSTAIEETRLVLARHQRHDRRLKFYGVFWFMLTILAAVGIIMFISALDTSNLSWAEIGVVAGGGAAVLWLFIATTMRSIKTSNNLKRLLEIYDEQLSSPDPSGH